MNNHSIDNETVISGEDSSVTLEFLVPPECDFFDGHFPQFKLLPAVGQFELISRFAKKYFEVSRSISSIKRMKFSSPILPDSKIRMQLDYCREKSSVAFKLWSALDETKIYSSGAFLVVSN
ncbi:MAG: hydroxymyristoyl-ACP dehydratase [Treponema sp.]|nr:hydroxymyristoyl-ACP dehydratase [Treponema sp.]